MKPAIKRRWLAALRSGKYVQGRWRLRTRDNTFCCLGVLCDLHSKTLTRPQWRKSVIFDYDWVYGRQRSSVVLPRSVQKWAGLRHPDPKVGIRSLSTANDVDNTSFEQIADLIQRYL